MPINRLHFILQKYWLFTKHKVYKTPLLRWVAYLFYCLAGIKKSSPTNRITDSFYSVAIYHRSSAFGNLSMPPYQEEDGINLDNSYWLDRV